MIELPIYILTTSHDNDRLNTLRDTLRAEYPGCGICVVTGGTGEDWRTNKKARYPHPQWREHVRPQLMANGQMNCIAGHVKIWDLIACRFDAPGGIVLEDDAEVVGTLPERLPIKRAKDKLDFFYLGAQPQYHLGNWKPAPDAKEEWREAGFTWGLWGYMLSKATALYLLEEFLHADHWIPGDELVPALYTNRVTENRFNVDFPRLESERAFPELKKLTAYMPNGEMIVRPRGFPSTTLTQSYAFKLHAVTFASDMEKVKPLEESAAARGISLTVLSIDGWDTSKEGGLQKLQRLEAWLSSYVHDLDGVEDWQKDNVILLVLDGYDTLITGSANDILRVYGSLRWPCIVGGETNYWPERGLRDFFQSEERMSENFYGDDDKQGGFAPVYPFPNSGVFIGPARTIYNEISEALENSAIVDNDDQAMFQYLVKLSPETWRIDTGASLIANLHGAGDHYRGTLQNSLTQTWPHIWHANGQSAQFPAHVQRKAAMQEDTVAPPQLPQLYGRRDSLLALEQDMYLTPILTHEEMRALIIALGNLPHEAWKPLENDNVPGDEYRGDLLEPVKQKIEEQILPTLNSRILPARIKGVSDIFAIRTGVGQDRLPLHVDISFMSATIKLQEAEEGGTLFFPRQGRSDAELEPGVGLWWPSAITHPHTTLPVRKGVRLSITVWTKG